jgi:hypoxia-inducible factor prolyl 4-hydroxylase
MAGCNSMLLRSLALAALLAAAPTATSTQLLRDWLPAAGVAGVEELLLAEGFETVESMLEVKLSEADLKELGLPMRQRKKLLKALQAEEEACDVAAAQAHDSLPLVAPPKIWKHALLRREGVEVGYRQRWPLEDGRTVAVTTLSMQPLVFLLDDYMTAEETDELIAAAETKQMTTGSNTFSSKAIQGDKHPAEYNDLNADGMLDDRELLYAADHVIDGHLTLEDVHAMMRDLDMDKDGDGSLDKEEQAGGPDGAAVASYLNELVAREPTKRSRMSDLTWLRLVEAPVARKLQQRMASVMAVPPAVVTLSQKMQVVRYDVGGQYTAHLDSGVQPQPRSGKEGAMPCCHLARQEERKLLHAGGESGLQMRPKHECRICRYATLLYNLNDVPEGCGGETVFPLANNATWAALDAAATTTVGPKKVPNPAGRKELMKAVNEWRVHGERESEYCSGGSNGGLRVQPRKGQAILWYNHHLQPSDSTLGEADYLSLHGGCRVRDEEGGGGGAGGCAWVDHGIAHEKWIANHWIEASEDYEEDEKVAHTAGRH